MGHWNSSIVHLEVVVVTQERERAKHGGLCAEGRRDRRVGNTLRQKGQDICRFCPVELHGVVRSPNANSLRFNIKSEQLFIQITRQDFSRVINKLNEQVPFPFVTADSPDRLGKQVEQYYPNDCDGCCFLLSCLCCLWPFMCCCISGKKTKVLLLSLPTKVLVFVLRSKLPSYKVWREICRVPCCRESSQSPREVDSDEEQGQGGLSPSFISQRKTLTIAIISYRSRACRSFSMRIPRTRLPLSCRLCIRESTFNNSTSR